MYTRPTPKETEARSPSFLISAVKQFEEHDKTHFNWLKEWQWQKGQSGNPKGRPKGKTMKEFAKEFLFNMSDEARLKFFKNADPDFIWKMAEGNPHQSQDTELRGVLTHQIVGMKIQKDITPKINGSKPDRIQDAQR